MKKYQKYLLTSILLISLVFSNSTVFGHAVQLGYCTSCNGDLRIWIEHWHTNEDPNSTTVTMQLNVNGTITNITGAPNSSAQNTLIGGLPGCFTPLNVFASCPSSSPCAANTCQDWIAYDFNGMPCGVPISVTIISGNTVFTDDCGGMYPASTGNIVIPCQTNQLPDVDTCAGNTVGPFLFPAGNTWTNDNPNIGLPASGAGDVPAFVAANNANTETGNIVVTNSCGTSNFAITVYPAPTSLFTANVGCPGQPIPFIEQSTSLGGPITNWLWDFGDGSPTFNAQNPPTHTFPLVGGPFNVSLTTTTANGCTHDTIIPVDPLSGLVANFVAPSVCVGSPSILTDASTPVGNITNWAWDFDNDGVVDDINQNSTFTFATAGTFNVELFVVGVGGCVDSILIPVIVNPVPVTNFTATNECFGTANSFTDISNIATGTINTWLWDFGDGLGTSVLQNPTYLYTNTGSFNVSLTVTSDSGCTDVFNMNVDVFGIPMANFSPSTACAGANSLFNNMSIIGSSGMQFWNWDFDNDAVVDDIAQNPTFVFPGGTGIYPVNLAIVDSNGCVHDTTINVNVSAQPTAIFTFSNECFGSATGFTDLSLANGGTITSWDWDFQNDGVVDASGQTPANGYPLAGNYTAELLVTTALGCVDSVTMNVIVNPQPAANFGVADECFNTISSFMDLSTVVTGNITGWAWDFGDGVGTSAMQNPTYLYTTPGTYAVTLTVTTDSLCSHTFIGNANVYFLPTAAFTTNNVCLNALASFTDNSNPNGGVINSWLWDFDGNGTTDDTNSNPTNSFTTDGTYNVQLIVSTASSCADTIVQTIVIHPMPVADFTFVNTCFEAPVSFTDISAVSNGTIVGWNWDFGNMNNSNLQNPSENYASDGLYNAQLTVTTDSGCTDIITQQIEVWPNPVAAFGPDEVCLNLATQFSDLSTVSNAFTTNNVVQWTWDFADGVGSSNVQNPVYAYTTDGIYPASLTVVTNNGCTHDTIINVTVNPLPQISFGAPTAGCAPNMCVTFVNTTSINTSNQPTASIANWLWDLGDGNTSISLNPTHCYQNDSYAVLKDFDVTLTATSDKLCTTTLTINQLVTVYPKPLADFTFAPDNANIYDTEITFSDQSIIGDTYLWYLGDGTTSIDVNPVHEYPDSGSYWVTLYLENIYGCKDTTSQAVIIAPAYALWIPNTFTPDADGINDFFFAAGFGIIELQTLVFDRWGSQVFQGGLIDSRWDGNYKGKKSVQDVYVYKIRARDVFNEWHEYIGRVTLLK